MRVCGLGMRVHVSLRVGEKGGTMLEEQPQTAVYLVSPERVCVRVCECT